MSSKVRMVAPILVLVAGVGIAAAFVATGPNPQRTIVKRLPPRVEVQTLSREDRRAEVIGLGTVIPAEEVILQPEVSGPVRYLNPSLVPGGRIRKKEVLVRIDARNYQLAVEERKAQVAKADYDLQLERGRQRVAKKEWDLLKQSTRGEADEALALRKPHLRNAEAALLAAQSALDRAELDLARTVLRAPFDALVQSENVEIGQLLGPTTSVATLVGTHAFWVQVSLPVNDLRLLDIPGVRGDSGSRALVMQASGDVRREGRIVRLLGELDPQGKMARVVVEVRDPLSTENGLPLLLGSVVKVRIEGGMVPQVYAIPRLALHEGGEVWAVEEGKLAIHEVDVVWRGRTEVFVRAEMGAHPQLIVSRLQTPVEGMSLRLDGAEAAAEVR